MDFTELDRDFFIFGKPIKTDLCEVRFLSYFEYLQCLEEFAYIKLNVLHFYYQYKNYYDEIPNKVDEVDKMLQEMKNSSLFEIIEQREDIKEHYLRIFKLVINSESAVNTIMSTEYLFMNYRKLILDMCLVQEDEVSPNEEIQKGIEISRKVNQQKGENHTFVDIVTSIVVSTNISFEQIADMNVFQVNALYTRIGAIMNYQTSTLFATAFPEQNIEAWDKHIDLFENRGSGKIKRSEFDQKFGKLLS